MDRGQGRRGDIDEVHEPGAAAERLQSERPRTAVGVEDPRAEQPRADALEISPSGPLYGRKLSQAKGVPGEMEQRVLDEEGLQLDDWRVRGLKLKGARRALQTTPEDFARFGLHRVEDLAAIRVLDEARSVEFYNKAFGLEIADRLDRVRREFGPRSVLYYEASGTKGLLNGCGLEFWRRFGGCTTTYGDLCWPAGLEATRLTLGKNEHNAPWDLANARTIIFWGKNAAETNIHQMPFVQQAREAARSSRPRSVRRCGA